MSETDVGRKRKADSTLLVVVIDTSPSSWLEAHRHEQRSSKLPSATNAAAPGAAPTASPSQQGANALFGDDDDEDMANGGKYSEAIVDSATTTTSSSSSSSGAGADAGASVSLYVQVVHQLLVFINSFLLLQRGNRVAVVASHPLQSRFVYPAPDGSASAGQQLQEHAHPSQGRRQENYAVATTKIKESLLALALDDADEDEDADAGAEKQPRKRLKVGTRLAAALSLAMCYITRMKRELDPLDARILTISVSPDLPSQYVPVMNSIFSAQKQAVPIDGCVLAQQDSLFLQQGSHLTSGIYFRPPDRRNLVQYLITVFLPGANTREHLVLPQQRSVDYRATCFCHRKVVDSGVVCPVCLSIFCKPSPSCSTCGARYAKLAGAPRGRKQKA